MAGFPNPFETWQHRAESPGEIAQKWAKWICMGSKWYLDIAWTEDECQALAKIIAKVLSNQKKFLVDQEALVK